MSKKFPLWGMICLLVILGLCSNQAAAQAVYGQIFGTVTDSSGAAIPGAEVTITDLGKGTVFKVLTNESGNYTQTRLVPGVYQVKVELSGFKTFVLEPVEVKADASARVDAVMEIGEITEQVTVSSETPLLKSDRADVSTILDNKVITELPIINRNFTDLQLLTPGTSKNLWQHATSENPQGSTQIMVNGIPFFGTSFQLDGTDNRDPILGIIVINPTLDSVQDFKMTTVNYDAEFGNAQSAVITAQTKSGSNDYHGTAYGFRRSGATAARNPFTEPTGPPPQKWSQFGGTLGGPIQENKLFFFGYYEGTRQRNGSAVLTNVPTREARTGDLSAYPRPVYDPRTGAADGSGRTQFAGNKIPANRLSSQALNLLKLIPSPNNGTGIENNYITSGTEIFDTDQMGGRSDYYATERFHIFGRYSYADFSKLSPPTFGFQVGGPDLAGIGFGGKSDVRNQSVATGFDFTISPKLLTDFRFGYFRYRVRVRPGGEGTSPAKDAGIPNLNFGDAFTTGMPAFFIDGTGGFRFGYALGVNRCNCPLDETENQSQFVNNWTRIMGDHTFKFGADYRYATNLRVPSDAHRSGELSFSTERTSLKGDSRSGLGLATFLLGDVTFFRRYVSETTDAGESQNRFFTYAQDTWRATPKLTLNLGLRWEYYQPEKVSGPGRGANLDLNTGEVVVYGVGGNPLDGGIKASLHNFSPRLGIAYQATAKTVVRMGYGRSYDVGTFGASFGHTVTQNLPVLAQQTLNPPSPFAEVFTLAGGPPSPVFPKPDERGRFKLPVGISMFHIEPRLKMPRVENWNLTLQHQFTPNLAGEIAYVGNQGVHRVSYSDFNKPVVGPGPANDRRPFFKKFGWTQGIQSRQCNCLSSNYHALQSKLEKKFTNDYFVLAHFTWSRAMDITHNTPNYPWNYRLDYGPADFDRAAVFVVNHIWDLPFGVNKPFLSDGPAANILGGWTVTGVLTLMSGVPFSPGVTSAASLNAPGVGLRPDKIGDPKLDKKNRDKWFNAGADTIGKIWGLPAPNTFGNAARNSLRGPGYAQFDMSVFKNYKFKEDKTLQFRTEFFNLFNRTNLGLPEARVDHPNAGKIFAIAPFLAQMRRVQFALRLVF